jgi:hypothetical protein
MGSGWKRTAMRFEPFTEIEKPLKVLVGKLRPRYPIEFRWDTGSKPQDLMGTTHAILDLVSECFIDTLLEERASGWSTYPVRLYDKAGLELPGYVGLAVTGRAGPVDRSKSRIELLPPPVPQGQAMYAEIGMYFDPESWDGSDIFIPEGTAAVCVVERVKRALEKRKLTNIEFEALSEREGQLYSEHPGKRPSAG